jgi:preprotein translocase subunit YajC
MYLPYALSILLQEGAAPQTPQPAPGFPGMSWVPILIILAIFYVVLILPERKKQKQRQKMLDALQKGDQVLTTSGLYGTVVQSTKDVVVLQVADNVRLRFARAAIQTVQTETTPAPTEEKVPSKA